MPRSVKSLKGFCQDTLTRCLDVLTDVGCVPYYLLKPSLAQATPQQLYRIEKANPDILAESDELWLRHCLTFRDVRDAYEQGQHRNPTQWRDLYLNRHSENERRKELIKQKVKSQYNKIQNEREQKSIKVLHGVLPSNKRTYEAARRSTMSKLFQQTKKQAQKATSIYNSPVKRSVSVPIRDKPQQQQARIVNSINFVVPIIRAPKKSSALMQAYESFKYSQPPLRHRRLAADGPSISPPLIAPKSNVIPTSHKEVIPSTKKSAVLAQDKDSNKRAKYPEEKPSLDRRRENPQKRTRI